MPEAVVIDEGFTWGHENGPIVSWEDTVIYEAHVKGLRSARQLWGAERPHPRKLSVGPRWLPSQVADVKRLHVDDRSKVVLLAPCEEFRNRAAVPSAAIVAPFSPA